jgi:hypothetical protein
VYLIGTSAELVSRVGQRAERAAWQQCDPLPIAILIYKRKCASQSHCLPLWQTGPRHLPGEREARTAGQQRQESTSLHDLNDTAMTMVPDEKWRRFL